MQIILEHNSKNIMQVVFTLEYLCNSSIKTWRRKTKLINKKEEISILFLKLKICKTKLIEHRQKGKIK